MIAKDTEYVVFDVETTGLSPVGGDCIIEIAAVKVKRGETIDTFESLINPQRSLPLGAQQVNKITEEMVATAPLANEVLPKFTDFIGGACLVGHNVKFDLGFLCHGLSKIGRKLKKETPAVDTLKMAKNLLPHLSNHKLASVAQYLGVPVGATHRALADVELTYTMFTRLLEVAQDQRLETFMQIYESFGVDKPNFKIVPVEQASLF